MRIPRVHVPMLLRAIKSLNPSEFGSSGLYSETKVSSQVPQMPANRSPWWQTSGSHRITFCLFRTCTCEMGEQGPNCELTTPAPHMNSTRRSLANIPSRACRESTVVGLITHSGRQKYQGGKKKNSTVWKYGKENYRVCWNDVCELHYKAP